MKHLYVRFQWIALYSRRGPAWVLQHRHVERCEDCALTRVAYNSCLMGNSVMGSWRRLIALLCPLPPIRLPITRGA